MEYAPKVAARTFVTPCIENLTCSCRIHRFRLYLGEFTSIELGRCVVQNLDNIVISKSISTKLFLSQQSSSEIQGFYYLDIGFLELFDFHWEF
ncbi:hypothetical protein ABEB36_003074 [Hypothenemus hampei]|uniref:Uncharacterized protein n=1 Tax=Hypothenemus hampei TaxID=57062 RepID=A0ABD1F7Y6_HYPHA